MDGLMQARAAWAALKAAWRYWFWSVVECALCALAIKRETARQLASLHPNRPQELFDAGFVCFSYDMMFDHWIGIWRPAGSPRGSFCKAEFSAQEWAGIPWHNVRFKEHVADQREFRAVPLSYARKHLVNPWTMQKAA